MSQADDAREHHGGSISAEARSAEREWSAGRSALDRGSISAEVRSAERERSAGRSALDGGHQIHLEKGVLDRTVEVNR
jgi:hypothetical protein